MSIRICGATSMVALLLVSQAIAVADIDTVLKCIAVSVTTGLANGIGFYEGYLQTK